MFAPVFVWMMLCELCSAYIYNLNETEYHRMPRVFHLDPYEPCLYANNGTGVYCSVKFDLVTDQPNELYDMIKEYSAKTEIHFNHSKLTYGICLTKTCEKFYQQNKTADPGMILEACLNESFWEGYKLKTRVNGEYTCDRADKKIEFDALDKGVAVVIGILLMLNIIGSLQEIYFGDENEQKGNHFLSCFGFKRNWGKMIAAVGEGPDARLSSLKGFSVIKGLGTFIVITVHSIVPAALVNDNPHYLEKSMLTNRLNLMLVNSTLMVQSFFVVSSFLLAFNLQIITEKHKMNRLLMLKVIFYRLWRLVPVLYAVMGIYLTWGRHLGPGPLWQDTIHKEVQDCRRDWWLHLLFVNNYMDYSNCMLHTWYLAADTQLFVVYLLVFYLTVGRRRKILLGLLFLAGVLMVAAHTYYQDLDAAVLATPENVRNLFMTDVTFNHTYKRGHTNMAANVMGFSLGLLIFHWQRTGYKINAGVKLRLLFWVSIPGLLVLPYYCNVFYMDAPRASIYMRTLCSALFKPLWCMTFVFVMVGLVHKFDGVITGFSEWQLWAVLSRLSYCMYVIHVPIMKVLIGTRTTLIRFTYISAFELLASVYTLTLLAAIPVHLMIEAPINQLLKVGFTYSKTKEKANSTKVEETLKNGDLKEKQNGISNINGVAKDIQNGVTHRRVITDRRTEWHD